MSRSFNKFVDFFLIPSAGLAVGLSFMKPWPKLKKLDFSTHDIQLLENKDVLDDLKSHLSTKYSNETQSSIVVSKQSQLVPKEHSLNHVGINLFRHQERFCIDPVFVRHEVSSQHNGIELSCYFHLGKQLLNPEDKTTYKGALSLVMDEVLCFTGFPKLPHKKGVTASLQLDFLNDEIPVDQLLVLNCKIKEQKGRKCITTCELLPVREHANESTSSTGLLRYFSCFSNAPPPSSNVLARGTCVLVEPKWFKYFDWVDIFSGDATR